MPSNIKSEVAFMQKIDFSGIFDLTKRGTDFDYATYLLNDKKAVFEVKKETANHTVEEITSSSQWQMYRDFIKTDTYLIYATHCCDISNRPIPVDSLTVRYIEINNKKLKLDEPLSVRKCLEMLNGKDTPKNRYYIKVKYPNGKVEYANRIVKDRKWSSSYYDPKCMNFTSIDSVTEYITNRYKKYFNQKYIYEIWHIDENGCNSKIKDIKYTEEKECLNESI